ncbi:hypothetical protein HPP92_007097 [Vanilla planifolia]|uniref:Uncharacterized protein n=1 Tax=Vanilla planifolia TaxID=51239 RepID=A0A835R9I1_VANPL|nr:hypothetical protein HPP92_007097 [Vanilla planifolia]
MVPRDSTIHNRVSHLLVLRRSRGRISVVERIRLPGLHGLATPAYSFTRLNIALPWRDHAHKLFVYPIASSSA